MEARYLTAFANSEKSLVIKIKKYLDELGAMYDSKFPVNPVNNQRVAQANVAQNYELTLTISWKHRAPSPILLIFDIESVTDIYLPNLNDLIAVPAEHYFGQLTLVYDSGGRARNLESFPFLSDLESVLRELIISRMLSAYGADWWNTAGIDQRLKDSAERYRKNEIGNPLHDHFEFHPIFYLDLKDLRKIIEDEGEKLAPGSTLFSKPFDHYDQVRIPDKIGEIRDLRNRVMHGKYLTEGNQHAIEIICGQFHRFLVRRGYVGNFVDRKLIDL